MTSYIYQRWIIRQPKPKKEEPKAWEVVVGFIFLFLVIKGLLS